MTYSSANKKAFPIKKIQRHITRCKRPHLLRPNSAYAELLLHWERYILPPCTILVHSYSYLRASSDFSLDAFHAGYTVEESCRDQSNSREDYGNIGGLFLDHECADVAAVLALVLASGFQAKPVRDVP